MPVRRSGIGYADFSGGDTNFIIGCTPISPGCAHCYAHELVQNRQGRDFSEIRLYPEKLRRLNYTKFKENGVPFRRGPGSRPIVFPVDLGDIMHKDVPYNFIQPALWTMENRSDADWLVLTKRPARLAEFYPDGWPENIWPGTTVESQDYVWRIDKLLQVKASVRWLSLEPMLEEINIRDILHGMPEPYGGGHRGYVTHDMALDAENLSLEGMDLGWQEPEWQQTVEPPNWVVVGAESGSKRRPFDENWAEQVQADCQGAGISFFYKQGSHRFPGRDDVLDGRTWKEFPR